MRPKRALTDLVGGDPVVARTVGALLVAVFVQGVGASAVLPLLPLFLRSHGTSDTAVGTVMASFFLAGVLTQYGAGHATDRLGHRRVLVGGLVLYAAASVAFTADVGAGGYAVLRGLQGVGAGAVQVATLALVGLVVPLDRRGRAFAAVFAAQLAGMALGPLAGGAVGVPRLRLLFIVTAAAALAAVIPVLAGTRHASLRRGGGAGAAERLTVTRALLGVALVGVSVGLVTGVYETCWSLLLSSRGAAAWQIGLSWTLFAVPFAAFSPIAGRLTDRLDRQWLATSAVLASAAFATAYAFIPSVAWLVGLGSIEAVAIAVAFPAAQSLLSQTTGPDTLGRAQGLFTTLETAAIAVAAAASGALFGVARWVPFVTGAALSALLVIPMHVLWRGMAGRVAASTTEPLPGAAAAVAIGVPPTGGL